MKNLKDYIIERGPAPEVNLEETVWLIKDKDFDNAIVDVYTTEKDAQKAYDDLMKQNSGNHLEISTCKRSEVEKNIGESKTLSDSTVTMTVDEFAKFFCELPIDCDFEEEYDVMTMSRRFPRFEKEFLGDHPSMSLEQYVKKYGDAEIEVKWDCSANGNGFYEISGLPEQRYSVTVTDAPSSDKEFEKKINEFF